MSEPEGRSEWILGLTLVLHLLSATLWSVTIPPFETPDEPGHARYVNFLLEHRRLPVAGEEAPGEAHQPPLYYALAATVAGVTGSGPIDTATRRNAGFRWYGGTEENKYLHDGEPAGSLHRLRLLSVILSAATILCVYLMGAVSGIVSRRAAAVAAAAAAFIPQFSFISASLNNDNLANALSAAVLVCLVRAVKSDAGSGPWALAGLLTGLGLLTKFTGLAMIPCGLIAVWVHRGSGRARTAAVAFLLPALLIPAPLLIRNAVVLGDALGAGAQIRTLPNLLDRKELSDLYFVTEFPIVLFESFWGRFGWMSFRAPGGFYMAALAATLIGLAGLLFTRRGAAPDVRMLFGAAIVIQVTQVAIYNLTFTQAQGRFLFPVIGPLVLAGCAGYAEVARRAGRGSLSFRGALFLTAGFAILNLSLLALVVAPAYQRGAALP